MKCLSLTAGSRVYGLDDLRTADGSIVPRVPAEYDGSPKWSLESASRN